MKLASLKGGRDGHLVVVSKDLQKYLPARMHEIHDSTTSLTVYAMNPFMILPMI